MPYTPVNVHEEVVVDFLPLTEENIEKYSEIFSELFFGKNFNALAKISQLGFDPKLVTKNMNEIKGLLNPEKNNPSTSVSGFIPLYADNILNHRQLFCNWLFGNDTAKALVELIDEGFDGNAIMSRVTDISQLLQAQTRVSEAIKKLETCNNSCQLQDLEKAVEEVELELEKAKDAFDSFQCMN